MAATPTVQHQGVALDAGLEERPRPKRLCSNIYHLNLLIPELEAPMAPLTTDGQHELVTRYLDLAHHQEAFGQPAAHHLGPLVEAKERLCTNSLDRDAPMAPLTTDGQHELVTRYLDPAHH